MARVANVLLLRFVAGNMDVNTLASKRSQLIGNTALVRKRRVIHKKVDLCVLASFSCRVYAETQGRKIRPVAGFRGPSHGYNTSCVNNQVNLSDRFLSYASVCTDKQTNNASPSHSSSRPRLTIDTKTTLVFKKITKYG